MGVGRRGVKGRGAGRSMPSRGLISGKGPLPTTVRSPEVGQTQCRRRFSQMGEAENGEGTCAEGGGEPHRGSPRGAHSQLLRRQRPGRRVWLGREE